MRRIIIQISWLDDCPKERNPISGHNQYQRLVYGDNPEEARKVMLPSWKPNEVWQEFMTISREQLIS
jgi:hypothetical protein